MTQNTPMDPFSELVKPPSSFSLSKDLEIGQYVSLLLQGLSASPLREDQDQQCVMHGERLTHDPVTNKFSKTGETIRIFLHFTLEGWINAQWEDEQGKGMYIGDVVLIRKVQEAGARWASYQLKVVPKQKERGGPESKYALTLPNLHKLTFEEREAKRKAAQEDAMAAAAASGPQVFGNAKVQAPAPIDLDALEDDEFF